MHSEDGTRVSLYHPEKEALEALRLLHLEKKDLVEYDGWIQTSERSHAEKEFDLLLSFRKG